METNRRRLAIICTGICMAVGLAGCGQSAPSVDFAKVHGTVRVNGKPQRAIQVLFVPDAEKGIKLPALAGAETDDQGNYSLKYSYHNKTGEGAPVGWNRAVLSDMSVGIPRGGQPTKPSAIPPAYGSSASTPLLKEVKPGDNTINLEVQK